VDESDFSAEDVAGKVWLPLDQVWKTLEAAGLSGFSRMLRLGSN
jgi:hypothetical protein